MRKNLAKAIRGDTSMMATARNLVGMQQSQLDQLAAAAPSSSGNGIFGALALIGGYLWLNK